MSVLKHLAKPKPPVSQQLVGEFGIPKPIKKAWHGQDKDAFFRDKYAHVHAKQMKNRPPKPSKSEIKASLPQPNPRFAQKLKEFQLKNPDTEYLFGNNPVAAALDTRKVIRVYTGHKYNDVDVPILEKCSQLSIPLQANTPLHHLDVMSSFGVHNKYVAVVRKREYPEFENISVEENLLNVGEQVITTNKKWPLGIYIDQVTDTHNMGAIMRCAYWLGADFVTFSKRNCAPMSPQVIKASSGASEFLPIFSVNHPLKMFESLNPNWNIIATLSKQRNSDIITVEPSELNALNKDKPCLLVVGSEDDGLRTSLVQRSTHTTEIKSANDNPLVDSLNVSVATALLLEKFRGN